MQPQNRTNNQGHCCRQLAEILGHPTVQTTVVHVSPEQWLLGRQESSAYPGVAGPGYYLILDVAKEERLATPRTTGTQSHVRYHPLFTCPFCKADLALRHFRLPRNWEHAFGYRGDAHYVAFYWTPFGDEAMYDDGHVSGDGNWQLFLHLYHALHLGQRYHLGSSDEEANDWLLLDREARSLAVLPREEAHASLGEQWPPLDPDADLVELDWETIQGVLHHVVDQARTDVRVVQPCDTCFYSISPGWLRAEDGGFDRCPVCNGYGFLPSPEGGE